MSVPFRSRRPLPSFRPTAALQGMAVAGLTLATASALIGLALGAATAEPFLAATALLSASSGLALVGARRLALRRARVGNAADEARLHLLTRDTLTGAQSRRSFLEALKEAVRPGMERPCALLLVDVDHFKSVNDNFGHAAGDQVLQRLVEVARATFPGATIGRLGGDEFAILIEGADEAAAAKAASAFLADLGRPRTVAGRQIAIGASIGLAIAPAHTPFFDELVVCADLALYESKRQGRGRATGFADSMLQDQKQRRFIERELRAAVLLDELQLHYQPLTDTVGTVLGVEALVRWRHPLRGTIMPGEFIEVAEESTLIDMVGEWVLRRACRDASALPGTTICINVSGAQLRRDGFVTMVKAVLSETGRAASRFTFEITESVALTATPGVLESLRTLRHLGARVALDDFGTGNCGFNSLRSLPIDCIKIDRSYIQTMESDPVAAILVSAIGAIGRVGDLAIVAEGIETDDHLRLAKAAGCTAFQGYHLGRPAPLAAFAGLAHHTQAPRPLALAG